MSVERFFRFLPGHIPQPDSGLTEEDVTTLVWHCKDGSLVLSIGPDAIRYAALVGGDLFRDSVPFSQASDSLPSRLLTVLTLMFAK